MKKIFVSGCYDIIHGGHIEFFNQVKNLGDYLIVSIASENVLLHYKNRKSSLPTEHKKRLLESISIIDKVVVSDSIEFNGLDFIDNFKELKPDVLISTEDDKFKAEKKLFCDSCDWKPQYINLPKTLNYEKISTTDIVNWIKAPKEVPLRVDFAGGWLDVPKFSTKGAFIVNCTISPKVDLNNWNYNIGGGLGGSAAYAILNGKNSVQSELDLGVGWQDPAAIQETGLCIWRSGYTPILEAKYNPDWLNGKMALKWTGKNHTTYSFTDNKRDFDKIIFAGQQAKIACQLKSLTQLAYSIHLSYQCQLNEGMEPLEDLSLARKYCGGGFGGYALYLFKSNDERDCFVDKYNGVTIEPYIKEYK